jgi:hypothetical protein
MTFPETDGLPFSIRNNMQAFSVKYGGEAFVNGNWNGCYCQALAFAA